MKQKNEKKIISSKLFLKNEKNKSRSRRRDIVEQKKILYIRLWFFFGKNRFKKIHFSVIIIIIKIICSKK